MTETLFECPETTYNVKIEKYPGIYIKARAIPLKALFKSLDMADLKILEDPEALSDPANMAKLKAMESLFDIIPQCVKEWNLSQNGERLEICRESIDNLETEFAFDLLGAVYQTMVGVSGPLEQNSTGGEPSEELKIPMEVL